jgi:hypothetical protein
LIAKHETQHSHLLGLSLARGPITLHFSEQNRTSSHARAHFLRQLNGRPHASQRFVGRSALARIFGMGLCSTGRHIDGQTTQHNDANLR